MPHRKAHLAFLTLLAFTLFGVRLVAGEPAAKPKSSAEQVRQIRELISELRNPRSNADRRVRMVRQLLALGPAGETAAKDYLDNEIRRLGGLLKDPPPTAVLDKQIEQLRKVLADLRQDANFTKEKAQTIGLPALDQLTAVWRQREALLSAHYQKLSRVAVPLSHLAEFLEAWETKANDDAALRAPSLAVGEYRERVEKLRAQTRPPEDEKTRQVFEENQKLAPQLPPDVVAGMQALNAMRIMCGLSPLRYDPKLCVAATGHSADMQAHNFFDHESPVPGKKTPNDRAQKAGTTASGENIYMGSNVTVDAIKAWFLSPGHHKNMLGESHRRQGLGRFGNYWTQMFGR